MSRFSEDELRILGALPPRDWPRPQYLRDAIAPEQSALEKFLMSEGLPEPLIRATLESGYRMTAASTPGYEDVPHVRDAFYGDKAFFGLIPAGLFLEYLSGGATHVLFSKQARTYRVFSLDEAVDRLSNDPNYEFYRRGEMVFRGQPRSYRIRRPVPNPTARDKNGDEELILPSYWRRFISSHLDRPLIRPPGESFAFYGELEAAGLLPIEALVTLHHLEVYGYDQATPRLPPGWEFHAAVKDPNSGDESPAPSPAQLKGLAVVQQHYGFQTTGIDVTFDLPTACFFALNKFGFGEDGLAGYAPLGRRQAGERVVYAFVCHAPPVSKTSDLFWGSELLQRLAPARPERQQCALRGTDTFGINALVPDLALKFQIAGSHSNYPTRHSMNSSLHRRKTPSTISS